ncbi:MAG: cation transporter [Ilumatobacteraceae bacterium]|jgi:cation diffusion facilitator family transporter
MPGAADPRFEATALRRSIAVTAVLGSIGIVWGIISGSQMILLDGVYAVIGIAVSFMLLKASAVAAAGPSTRFPYGREAVTPLVIGLQGVILLATLLYALVEAVFTIRDGGSIISAGPAMAYAVTTTIASLIFWWWLRARSHGSDLLAAETIGWRVAAFRGLGMSLGFLVLLLLQDSSWDGAAPYVDPAMVMITCVVFLPSPIRMVRSTVVELLEGAPPPEVQEPVHAVVRDVFREFEIDEPVVRMTKVGPKLYVEIDAEVRPDATVADEHRVRTEVRRRLEALPFEVWLNFELVPPGGVDRSVDGMTD